MSNVVKLPDHLWKVIEPQLRKALSGYDEERKKRLQDFGLATSFQLRDGSERLVHVNWQGEIFLEEYRDGTGRDAEGPPRFTCDDIESWGYSVVLWKPTFFHPFRTCVEWMVEVYANGQMPKPIP